LLNRRIPSPATYLSRGKIGFIGEIVVQEEANLLVFDRELSPAQQRNLRDAIGDKSY